MENYPDGVTSKTKGAPWNERDPDEDRRFAICQITGEDVDRTVENFIEFFSDMDGKRQPLLTKPTVNLGLSSTPELLLEMLDQHNNDKWIAAAAREFAARYIAWSEGIIDRIMEEKASHADDYREDE